MVEKATGYSPAKRVTKKGNPSASAKRKASVPKSARGNKTRRR